MTKLVLYNKKRTTTGDIKHIEMTQDILTVAREIKDLKVLEHLYTNRTFLWTFLVQQLVGNMAIISPRFLEKLGKLAASYIFIKKDVDTNVEFFPARDSIYSN